MRLSYLLALVATSPILAQGFTPEEAVKRMRLPEGFSAKLVACEPMIRQPLSISFDEKGRMWVLQCLQYPNPAGLTPVKQDQYLRTVWDRVPDPPPKGPKGADRLTILYDPDEHGVYRKSKAFVAGLNIASGFCLGHGGVFVVQPPYLLYYPDKDGDDVPDSDPEVLLSGFGMDDTYGLDFDKTGQVIAGTNWGGFAMLHQLQGAYYVKGFSKHGPLHNPHTYGYFDHVPYTGFKGGHVTCGGIVYQADAFPPEYRDQYIAGNLLSNAV